jgi:hypothetical protein
LNQHIRWELQCHGFLEYTVSVFSLQEMGLYKVTRKDERSEVKELEA